MSIKKSFNGKVIRKPGSYSRFKVDNTSGVPTTLTGIVFLVGESSKGAPGAVSGIQEFPAERLSTLIETYGEGPLVDCANAATKPSKQAGIEGAATFLIWKTNQSTQANATLSKTSDDILLVKDRGWGAEGNELSVIVGAGSSGNQKVFSIAKLGDTTEALGENPAQDVITLHYTGNGSACSAAIASGSTRAALTLTTTITSPTDSSANLSVTLKNYTMKTLVDYLNAQTGYVATLETATLASKKANELDPVTFADIKTGAVTAFRLQKEMEDLLNTSQRVEASLVDDPPVAGVPDEKTTMLTTGVKGASTNDDFAEGFTQSLGEDYNYSLACVSRDAADDISDAAQGFTDSASTYDVASVLAGQESHLRLRGSTTNRREAAGFGGVRTDTKAAAFTFVSDIGSELMQVCIEDCLTLDAKGSRRYMHPHVLAAIAMGMRAGQPTGEPLTHKYGNVFQVGQFIDPATGVAGGDFNSGLDYADAIDNGVLFMEKVSGFRWVVDNTTYGIDESFVFNRGSVMDAVFYTNKTIRAAAESIFVGKKVSNGAASSIKNAVRNKLRELNKPEVNIITSSDDAPEGFREDTFVVTVEGNTARVQVEYKPCQSLDFIFFDFTLGDIKQSA